MPAIRRTAGLARIAALLMIAGLLAACGNKGPLVKPNATTRPAPDTTMPSPDAPARPTATDGS